jgi:hypothetical protein
MEKKSTTAKYWKEVIAFIAIIIAAVFVPGFSSTAPSGTERASTNFVNGGMLGVLVYAVLSIIEKKQRGKTG